MCNVSLREAYQQLGDQIFIRALGMVTQAPSAYVVGQNSRFLEAK